MFGGNGLGHVIAAAAVTLLVRLFTLPSPAGLLPENEGDDPRDKEDKDADGGKAPVSGKVPPVTVRWSNITCSISRKSSEPVSSRGLIPFHIQFIIFRYRPGLLESCSFAKNCLDVKFDFGFLSYFEL